MQNYVKIRIGEGSGGAYVVDKIEFRIIERQLLLFV